MITLSRWPITNDANNPNEPFKTRSKTEKREKTCGSQSQFVLVLFLIGKESCRRFKNESLSNENRPFKVLKDLAGNTVRMHAVAGKRT